MAMPSQTMMTIQRLRTENSMILAIMMRELPVVSCQLPVRKLPLLATGNFELATQCMGFNRFSASIRNAPSVTTRSPRLSPSMTG